MNILKQLDAIEGKGTSMITIIIKAGNNISSTLDQLKREYSVSANIKSRI